MKDKKCLYCRSVFLPSRYHPDQQVCRALVCQRKRRTEYHRKKRNEDAGYREQCRDSQSKWLAKNPSYMKTYMAQRRAKENNLRQPIGECRLDDLLQFEKNNLALNLGAYQAKVWLVSADTESAKNILASAQIIVVQALNSYPTSPSVAKRTSL